MKWFVSRQFEFNVKMYYCKDKGMTCLTSQLKRCFSTKSPVITPVHHVHRKYSYDLKLNNGNLDKFDFQRRRYNLAKKLASLNPVVGIPLQQKTESEKKAQNLQREVKEHFVLIPSAQRTYMVDKIPYVFRQATDFRYLTGSKSHDAALALKFYGDANEVESTIILPVSTQKIR